jgi:hypothetical protein
MPPDGASDAHQRALDAVPSVLQDMTKRLADWIDKQAIMRTFASIADEVVVVEGTVRSVFRDYANELKQSVSLRDAEEADNAVFTESDVATLNRYGHAPATTTEDMFAMLTVRQEDLNDLLLQDVSPRAAGPH